jgi:restriction system protein
MALKMSNNSLIAILLRNPWWMSFAVVALIILLATALVPAPYTPFGWMAALPFVVVGLVAAKRQWGQPSARAVEALLQQASTLNWSDFSTQVVQGFERQGYSVSRINSPGADLLLNRQGNTTVVACKRWKAAAPGIEGLKELVAAQAKIKADKSVWISLNAPTDSANRYAHEHGVEILDASGLAGLLAMKP